VYAGRLDEGHEYLLRSINATPAFAKYFSDPYIFLSQLYWNQQYGGEGYARRALDMLWKLVEIKSGHKEFYSNLGLILQTMATTGE
jgi:hypothetical protein